MYEPVFNSILVQINDKDAQWGSGNDESMLGKSYSKGTVIRVGNFIPSQAYPLPEYKGLPLDLADFKGKQIMWNEGVEAGTVFDSPDGKQFAMIYWWDIRGVKVDDK